MRTYRAFWLVAVFVSLSGCRSGGSAGWAVWNPFAKSKDTAIAKTAPELPSQQVATSNAAAGKNSVASAIPATGTMSSAPPYTPPAAVARTAAATPTTTHAGTNDASPYAAPATSASTMPSSPVPGATEPAVQTSTSLASGTGVNPSGPYNPNGYQPPTTAAPARSADLNRYGSIDRYASTTSPEMPSQSSETSSFSATSAQPSGDRYAIYDSSATAPPVASSPVAVSPVTPQPVTTASATVNLPAAPGQYRPAGTATYAVSNPEQVNVASLPEKPTGTTPTTTVPIETPSGYPSTGEPAPGSIYGVPSYR